MTRDDYYSLREIIGIEEGIMRRVQAVNDIMKAYPNTKSMTLEEIKDFLWERYIVFSARIQKTLNVE